MKVTSIMTKNVLACTPDEPLTGAARIMWESDCGCVPVVDANNAIIGMVTDRDICMAAYTRGLPLSEITVSDAMSRKVFSCTENDSIEAAEAIMRQKQIRRIPVTNREGRLTGIVSLNDIARRIQPLSGHRYDGLGAEAFAHTVAAVSEPSGA